MHLLNKYKNKKEPVLEPLFRWLRFHVAKGFLKAYLTSEKRILDFGCGPESKFFDYLVNEGFLFKEYVGFDMLASKEVKLKQKMITRNLNDVSNKKYDLLSMFAVLEHLDYPDFDFSFITKLVVPGGYLLLTTPTKISKPVLEFLSYKLGIVSRREIEEHKHYFNIKEIIKVFTKYGFEKVDSKVFEFGMNNYVLMKKSEKRNY